MDEEIFLTGDKAKDTRRVTYLIFISAVAVLAFLVALAYYVIRDEEIRQVLLVLDTVYALIFLTDFFLRLRHSSSRRQYMLHWGWLDLTTSIPGIPALRIVRTVSVWFGSKRLLAAAPAEVEEEARSRLGESVLFLIVFVGLTILTIGSILVIYAEQDAARATIRTGYDAVWWSLVTVSTVGYGDEVPVTPLGRLIGVLMIIVGVALFTTITSYLASTFTDQGAQRQRQEQIDLAKENATHLADIMERILRLEEKIAETQNITLDEGAPADEASAGESQG